MSTAAAVEGAVPAKGGKKKLIIIIAAVLCCWWAAAARFFVLKKKPRPKRRRRRRRRGQAEAAAPRPAKARPKHPPVFVPLDPFTVNLADNESERYAQVGITLEIDDAKSGEELKPTCRRSATTS